VHREIREKAAAGLGNNMRKGILSNKRVQRIVGVGMQPASG